MARNLLKGGHTVTVYARRSEAMEPIVNEGAHAAASPADVASRSDVTITMVIDTRAVEEVTLGPGGIVEGAQPGSVVVDHSTIDPDGARRVAAALESRGVHMLDAPVSGGAAVADAGTLSIMVGGDERTLERVRPILQCYGTTIVHIGPSGAGQIAKACNQICTIVNTLGTAEAILMAERAGIDPTKVKDVLMSGFGASRMLEMQAPKMIARDFDGKVESRLHHKDIHIVLAMARALGIELPASSAAARVLEELQRRGGAKSDTAAVFAVLANPKSPIPNP
ncbi:MAG TPA: NAD(P)-dependent oxidoreductase [Vicinamibacterales bacterium]|nr:NAD(P)-dependent oxidoreductase [Vicinamibacterales bacterium]